MTDNYILTDEDVELINGFTRKRYEKDMLYAFPVVLCDNEVDRDFEKFSDEALKKLSELYIGKTGIFDHNPESKNQQARIFKCVFDEVKGKTNSFGEAYKRVLAYAYIPRNSENEALIDSIDSGIKKEISVGCAVSKKYCSVCHTDLTKDFCEHIKGKEYNGQICCHILDEPYDAYEWSFVAVPSQKQAGVLKSYKRNENMEEILKKLEQKTEVTLNSNEVYKLKTKINELNELASIGKSYKDDLKKSVIKLCKSVEPELKDIIEKLAENMDTEQLKAFKRCYEKKRESFITPAPQLFGDKKSKSEADNNEYSI